MKTIFDKSTREELISRINSLNETSKASWGKMAVAEMVHHCTICEDYYHGNVKVKRSFLGRIIGKMAIKGMLKDATPGLRKNSPTSSEFKVSDSGLNLEAEKDQWKKLIARYETFRPDSFLHWFFGKMTKEQLGQFIYRHSDHHLRQFGV